MWLVRPTNVFVLIYNMAAKTLHQRSQNQAVISFFFCRCSSVFLKSRILLQYTDYMFFD